MSGLSDALRIALGGLSGGLQGYGQKQELLRTEAEAKRLRERQAEQDKLTQGNAMLARIQSGVRPFQEGETLGEGEQLADLPGLGKMVIGQSIAEKTAAARAKQQELASQQQFERKNKAAFQVLQQQGQIDKNASYDAYKDLPLEGQLQDFWKNRALGAAMQRANVMAEAQRGMGALQTVFNPATGMTEMPFVTRGGQITSTGLQAPPKEQSAGAKAKIAEYDSAVDLLEKAKESAKANPDAFGFKTYVPGALLGRGSSPESNRARADVAASIMKIRRSNFGTAVSKYEASSGESLFPAKGDSYQQLVQKLDALTAMAKTERDNLRGESGMPSAPKGGTTPQSTQDRRAELWDRYVKSGMDKATATARVLKEIP